MGLFQNQFLGGVRKHRGYPKEAEEVVCRDNRADALAEMEEHLWDTKSTR
jgi:hypothetical protein